jgi:Tfp pilus assembly protein PilO
MKKKESSSANTIVLFIIAILALLLVVLNISSLYQIQKTSDALNSSTIRLDEYNKRFSKLNKMVQEKEQLMASFELLSKKIPLQSFENHILNSIEESVKENKTELINLQFGDYKENQDLIQIPLTLTVKGKYSDLIRLFTELEDGERLVRIDGINLTKDEDLKVRADIIAFTYFRKAK